MPKRKKITLPKLVNRILDFKSKETIIYVASFSFLWLLILGSWAVFRGGFLENNSPELIDHISVALGFFFLGCGGLITALRKELPQIFILRGKPAVILGTLWVILSWGIAGYAVFLGILYLL